MDPKVHAAILLIRLSIGAVMIAFGLSQFLRPNIWTVYIPGWLKLLIPAKPTTFMREHALGNFCLGVLFAVGAWPVVMAWIVAAWWLSILPFALWHDLYIGLRDAAIIAATVAVIILLHT